MSPPEKAAGPAANRPPNTATITGQESSRTDTTAFGLMMDRPLTTTRTCAGWGCWCRVGSTIAWPLTHDDEMARMFRELRSLEILEGVKGL